MQANHKEAWVPVNTGKGIIEVKVSSGQFLFGRKSAAKKLNMKESTLRNRIKKLQNMANLDIKSDTHYSLITVINWESYQGEEKKEDRLKDSQRTAKGHKQE